MKEKIKEINELLEKVALKMDLKVGELVKKIPVMTEETISILKFSLSEKTNESEDEWIKVSPKALLELKGITHPHWEDAYSPQRFNEIIKDADSGVTFAFYWNEGFLCWER
jgi:hypothetical protein